MKLLLKDMLRPLYLFIKNKNEREFYRIYDKYSSYKRYYQVDNVKFLEYTINVPDLPSFIWQFKEIFVDEIYKFETNSKKPVIFDCGANIGISCLYFKRLYPNAIIKAFEAEPNIAKFLIQNLSMNGINDVEIINKAVWIDNGEIEFGMEGADGGSIYQIDNKTKVQAVRLKDYLDNEPGVDLLKIDIEGAEYQIIKDCEKSLGKVRNIFIEYHSWNSEPQKLSEILEILEKSNFRYFIQNVNKRKHPFINQANGEKMDLQLNMWAIKL